MNDLPSLKAGLVEQGLWAKKSFGQHFLLDPSINARIAAFAAPLANHPVVEVGPGPGGLTRALLEAGAAPLIAIEKDRRFLPLLEPLVAWSSGRLRLVEADALVADEAELLRSAKANGAATIVANLPYNVATLLLVKWLKAGPWRGPMVLMFQKEVAQRIVARAGDEAYGRLAVITQAACTPEIAMTLPPGAFTPAPKVESAVVRFDPLPAPFAHLDVLERLTAAAFGQRRKMVRASLKRLGLPEALFAACGIAPTARAEEIPVEKFLMLAGKMTGGFTGP
ncbi:MAG TPA: 16S rRNA (adenine(1518)-N(6)/adenine(1519)-N(6))-dimethyltransferase RsmA [Caulobacterales bacterium]|nr:16S rRNA (adenine(1518)-N(6)/adenine(1519)-N(6))-dimethyltransferase RsmA [Caulobacterales bacterium]